MLELTFPSLEFYDELNEEFVTIAGTTIRLEHSLVSISKWEARWKTPFLSNKSMTVDQTQDYIKCMTVTQNVNPLLYTALTNDQIAEVNRYIEDRQTATTFNDANEPPNRQVITSELVYFWMAQYNIPMECQKWHFSRLITLIRIASIKNQPEKKMSKRAIMSRNRSLNAARRKSMHTRG